MGIFFSYARIRAVIIIGSVKIKVKPSFAFDKRSRVNHDYI